MESASAGVVVAWVTLHALALTSAWGTRVATGSRMEFIMQLAFLAAMAGVGGAAFDWEANRHRHLARLGRHADGHGHHGGDRPSPHGGNSASRLVSGWLGQRPSAPYIVFGAMTRAPRRNVLSASHGNR